MQGGRIQLPGLLLSKVIAKRKEGEKTYIDCSTDGLRGKGVARSRLQISCRPVSAARARWQCGVAGKPRIEGSRGC